MRTIDGARTLEILLSQMTREDRERLRVAWERHAQGDPDSLPAIYALADRFSLTAHAALLKQQENLLESFKETIGAAVPWTARGAATKSRVWITGTLCCLAAGVTGAAVERRLQIFPDSAAGEGDRFLEHIRAAGGDLTHRVSRRDGRTFHVLELRAASSRPPEAYLSSEHHGVIVFEHHPPPIQQK